MRVRLRFSKQGKVRFTSHRDTARMWERALRRLSLPVAYSEGFSPRPKLHFGLALSTGYESVSEFLDVDLLPVDLLAIDELPERLTPVLPTGIDVTAAVEVPAGTPSLQQAVTVCAWHIEITGPTPAELLAATDRALAADELLTTRERKGKPVTDDLRPYFRSLMVGEPTASGVSLVAELGTQPRSLRPSELISALDPSFVEGRVCRTHQWIEHDGARREPLDEARPSVATSAPHAEARAS
ncbi:TIGR03936 family radical SAM-associated protein [soil metagenome]